MTLLSPGMRELGGDGRELVRLLAAVARKRAGQRVEQEALAVLADLRGEIPVLQRGREAGQDLGDISGHALLPLRLVAVLVARIEGKRSHNQCFANPAMTPTRLSP